MSTKYKHSHEVPTARLARRLDELSDVVGQPGEERDRELTQRIPAELDRDADLVLCEAAQRLVKLETERDTLAAHVERLRNACQMAFQTPLDEHYSKGVNVALHHAIESTGENNLDRLKAEWDQDELQPIWETLIKVADMLGIDPEEARMAGGKPSEVYAAHLARLKAQWQAEALEKLKNVADVEYGTTGVAVDIAAVLEIAAELRQQAEQC